MYFFFFPSQNITKYKEIVGLCFQQEEQKNNSEVLGSLKIFRLFFLFKCFFAQTASNILEEGSSSQNTVQKITLSQKLKCFSNIRVKFTMCMSR